MAELVYAADLKSAGPTARAGSIPACATINKKRKTIVMIVGCIYESSSMMTAYHGTTAKFEAFDLSKAHTGEGATMYGYGVYVTTNEKTALHYMKVAMRTNKKDEGYVLTVQIPENNGKDYLNIEKNDPKVYDYLIQGLSKLRPDAKDGIKMCMEYCKENDSLMWLFQNHCDYSFTEEELAELLQKLGFLGIRIPVGYRESGMGQYEGFNYVLFDAKNVHIINSKHYIAKEIEK